MKKFKLFVEGIADKTFFQQYINYVFNIVIPEQDIITTGGWQGLQTNTIKNQIQKNTAEGGMNIVLFDADDDVEKRRRDIEEIRKNSGMSFDLFLMPDNRSQGALENLLEQIINPSNQCVMDCWHRYENDLSKQIISWKEPPEPTAPSIKSMIYGYLEVLLGSSKSQKEKIKERNRDYTNKNHWTLKSEKLLPLKSLLSTLIKGNLQ